MTVSEAECASASSLPDPTTMIDICYLVLRDNEDATRLNGTLRAMRNIDAFAPGGRARYHIVTDEPPNSTVRLSLCRLLGPASPLGGRVHLYSLSQAPKEAHDLMAQLRLLTRGPGYTYLWKNLLHYVLPSAVRRVLLLDADIMVSAPIAELWSHFGAGSVARPQPAPDPQPLPDPQPALDPQPIADPSSQTALHRATWLAS